MKRKIKKKQTKALIILSITVIILLIIAIFTTAIGTGKKHSNDVDYYHPESRYEKVASTIIEGTETKGWIMVQGTNIDYPVALEKEIITGVKEYVWLSTNYIEGETRMAIYGHNIQNVSSKPLINEASHVRFEQLMSFVYKDFAQENLYIQYSHDGIDELYKIYAIGFYDGDSGVSYHYTIQTDRINNYIDTVRKNSIYDYDVDVNNTDELLSLITCTRFFGTDELTTFKVDARKVRSDEKIEKYSVQTNMNYDILDLE